MSPTDRMATALCRALAAEMRSMGALLETVGEVLAADQEVSARHLGGLQQFDLVAQQLGEGARLLDEVAGGACVHETLQGVRLEQLRARLQASVGKS